MSGDILSLGLEERVLEELKEKLLALSLNNLPVSAMTQGLCDLLKYFSSKERIIDCENFLNIPYVSKGVFTEYGRNALFSGERKARAGHIVNFLIKDPVPNADPIYMDWKSNKEEKFWYITYFDPEYPRILREIKNPPALIYGIGDRALLRENKVTIVGTRKASTYGLKIAFDFSKKFSINGYVVVSGLALGIDAACHRGALEGSGKTIAVEPCGIDRIYPGAHRGLAKKIMQKGLIISEFPPGSEAKKYHFIMRNRILSGLSGTSLVVESGLKSGSMITANCAADQGRNLYAIPGNIDQPRSQGCNYLIRNGAILVSKFEDMAEDLNISLNSANPVEGNGTKGRILADLKNDPMRLDDLKYRLDLDYPDLWSSITILELRGKIYKDGSGYYHAT